MKKTTLVKTDNNNSDVDKTNYIYYTEEGKNLQSCTRNIKTTENHQFLNIYVERREISLTVTKIKKILF